MSWNIMDNTSGGETKTPITTFPVGATRLRALDPAPVFANWSHWVTASKSSLACLGKDCPICAVNKQDRDNDRKQRFGNSRRFYIRVWNADNNRMEILIKGREFFEDLRVMANDPDLGDIRGYDIKVTRSGEGRDTKYSILPGNKSSYEEFIADKINEIQEVDWEERFKPVSKEIMIMLMEGKSWEDVKNLTEKKEEGSEGQPWTE